MTPDDVVKALAPWVQGTPESEPDEAREVRSQGLERKIPPATILKKGPETVRASDEAKEEARADARRNATGATGATTSGPRPVSAVGA